RVLTLVLEGRGLRDAGTEIDGDDAEWDGGEEGDAPSEVLHGGGTPEVRGHPGGEGNNGGSGGEAGIGAQVEEGAVVATATIRGELGNVGGGSGVFTA